MSDKDDNTAEAALRRSIAVALAYQPGADDAEVRISATAAKASTGITLSMSDGRHDFGQIGVLAHLDAGGKGRLQAISNTDDGPVDTAERRRAEFARHARGGRTTAIKTYVRWPARRVNACKWL